MEQYAEVVLDLAGNAVPGASVQVLVGSVNGALAPIFDASGTPQQNPVTTGPLGEFAFQVANGKYVLRVLVNGTPYRTVGPLTFYDPADDADRVTRGDVEPKFEKLTAKLEVTPEDYFIAGEISARPMCQRAIDAVSAAGGGVVRMRGVYPTDAPLYLKANVILDGDATPGFFYPQQGGRILANFTGQAWAIDTDTRNQSNQARLPARDALTGAQLDNGTYNRNENCGVRNLYIQHTGQNLYGGVRLTGCPGFVLENVGVDGTDIGYVTSASWGCTATRCWSLTYLYGFAAVNDTNGLRLNGGYFNRRTDIVKTITNSNRPSWVPASIQTGDAGINPAVYSERIGVFGFYAPGCIPTQVIAESWDVARCFLASKSVVSIGGWSEATLSAVLVVGDGGDYTGHGYRSADPPTSRAAYNIGVSSSVDLTHYPAKAVDLNQYGTLTIRETDHDLFGWAYNDRINFAGANLSTMRVSATGSVNAIGGSATYTTFDEALRRIEARNMDDATIRIKAGETMVMSAYHTLNGRDVSVEAEGGGAASIRSVATGGYPTRITLNGNIAWSMKNISMDFSVSGGLATDDRGLFAAGETSSPANVRFTASGGTINLGGNGALFQQLPSSASRIAATLTGVTFAGTGSAAFMSPAFTNAAAARVDLSGYGNTISTAVSTNGWLNATVTGAL